ncbi:MAG: cytochrome c oxidase subunit 3 [Acidobacteria bacterium]|nr:cytochrome c oxidase subunit 3 [Acidobacteriota bacterium]
MVPNALLAEKSHTSEIEAPAHEAGAGRAAWKGSERLAEAGSEQVLPYTNADLGLWGLLATVTMLFAGFTSAYLVRRVAGDWQPIAPPSLLYLNTVVLVLSSMALEVARVSRRSGQQTAFRAWISACALLGISFLGGQILAWRQLEGLGIYLPTSPHSSFFYLLTGLHSVHLLGGVVSLLYAFRRTWSYGSHQVEPATLRLSATYWHFLTGIWLYLFFLLFVWR